MDSIPGATDAADEIKDAPAPAAASMSINLEADATTGYASIQNSVPVIRSVELTNHGADAIEGMQVLVTCNPPFARGTKLRFDRLGPGESRRIAPIDLVPDHAFLAGLQETVKGAVRVTAVSGTHELAHLAQPMNILAYDQWAGTRALPELLAAFSMPNDTAVDALVGKASKLLRSQYPEFSMDGYQAKSRDVVWKQVSALYSAVCAEALQYSEPAASFGTDGQRIRTPDRILDGRVATCLDLAMLFASCLEQAGLRPVVLFKEGHAWVGVWLHPANFSAPLIDDVQAIRKRVDGGEFITFETTGVAQHASRRPSLRNAVDQGRAHLLDEGAFRYAVDVHRAREVRIKPLPSRTGPARRTGVPAEEEAPAPIEPTPPLPPLDADQLTAIDLPPENTPEGRLSRWKSRLLDLTLRNRLLNFKPTKATLQLAAPDLGKLEDALAEGHEFRVRALPTLMEGEDPRVADVHVNRGGRTPSDEVALAALDKRELLARVRQDDLDANLLAVFSAARTAIEEGGSNTLYLALGFLRWTEAERAEATHVAPILLVPVTLQRQSVRSGFRLARHDDEAIVNPTLLQLLESNFELRIRGLDVVHQDDRGVDVQKILQAFRMAVAEIPKWEVLEQAYLGIFSFTKYLMWKDLQDRTDQLKANRVVKHLIENPGQAFPREDRDDERERRLDDAYKPQDILTPMLSDSSQLRAICAVDAGRDLVLEGPPGTGKSQTITNLIAHSLAKGKSVLFVSEKLAALDVVQRRLTQIGLAPFCLELHSSKAKKADVVQQLGASLDIGRQRTAADWAAEAERLARLRSELNELVDALHREHRCGLTVFDAIGTCIANAGNTPSPMPWADAQTHDKAQLDALRESTRRMAALATELSAVQGHPLRQIGHLEWSPSWQDDLESAAAALDASSARLHEAAAALGTLVDLAIDGASLDGFTQLDALADVVMQAPKVPAGLARQAHDPVARARVRSIAQHGLARASHWADLAPAWKESLARLNATELQAQWSAALSAWWLKRWLSKRTLRTKLTAFRSDGTRPHDQDVGAMLAPLREVNEHDQRLRAMESDAQALLDDTYAGLATDWKQLEHHEQWASRFADALNGCAGAFGASAVETARARLQSMLGEQRAMLSTGSPGGRTLLGFRDAWGEFWQRLAAMQDLAKPLEPMAGPAAADGALARVRAVLAGWLQADRQLRPWCLWRKAREHALAQGLQGVVASIESGKVALPDVASHFEFSYRHWWVKRVIDREPVLRAFSSADHERKIREFRQADAQFQELTKKHMVATLAAKLPAAAAAQASPDSEMGKLRRELTRQRGHQPVRRLLQGLPTLLPRLKPCLLMSPLSVAQYLDAGHAQFDLVVFDEASQIPVWDAVGAIARGRQLVVVGDPKQLPPTSFFGKSTDADDEGAGADEDVREMESILDECLGTGMNRLSLQWHYRSRHESLITFSNTHYYDSRLVTFPSPVTDDVAVRFERVHGVYDRGGSRTNRAEAEAIVKAIEAHYLRASASVLSLGVVTFNQPQQALIETLLDARRKSNADLDRALSKQGDEPLFIKNLENVQGDERNVIMFSITYGADLAGRVTMNFGPLNGEGGHRRLNVAISRAREKVLIFSSLIPEQIDLSRVRAAGVRDLKHYLEFALRGSRALASQSVATGQDPDSPFESAVIGILRNKEWTVHPQVGCSGYRIDIGVVDPRAPGRYLLGIECDGRTYHSGATARDRDRLRQHILEGLGWRIHRIWSTDWWLNREAETDKLVARLEALANEELVPDAEGPNDASDSQPTELDDPPLPSHEATRSSPLEVRPTASDPPLRDLPTYKPASLRGGDPADFYEPLAAGQIALALRQVVNDEGPLPQSVAFRRVARAWGFERTGSRISERLRSLLLPTLRITRDGDMTFLWPTGADPATWSAFRAAGEDETSRRQVDEVCVEELSNIVLDILGQWGAAPRQDVARNVCRLVGVSRMSGDAESRIGAAVDRLLSVQRLEERDGFLRPVVVRK